MESFFTKRLVPVTDLKDADDALPVAEALLAGGLNLIEVTFRNPCAEKSIRLIRSNLPEMYVGAGTLLKVDQISMAQNAGAHFGVAPGLNKSVFVAARNAAFPFIPGAMTPSEIETAMAEGHTLLKFFPAHIAGGREMIKALQGPYLHTGLRLIVLGGVLLEKMEAYLNLPLVAAVGGTWSVNQDLIAAKDWKTITARTREAVELVNRLKEAQEERP